MGLKTTSKLLLLLLFALECNICFGSWTGPDQIVSGLWGTAPGQFAIKYQDTYDTFPTTIAVSESGKIAISEDQTLKRVQIFSNGTHERTIDTFAFDLVFNSSQ